ncbi:M20 family metallo-hydrolase [Virgibacillus byunsanensis]|uniref:M20 family metallo-hydrolase n=1 Tax=Virgibacillus byunsanensis TaxID=570945 RepID=A0ABW3LGM4_9BACI
MTKLASWIQTKLHELNVTDTMDVPEGFTRLSFSKEEAEAHNHFQKVAKELGLFTYQDGVGNQWAVWEVDKEVPTIAIGSHLDTDPCGGGYDGVAGVLCALGAIKNLKDSQYQPAKNIAVICFVSEESARFGISTIGSKAITGMLNKAEMSFVTDIDGVTIKEAMEEYGLIWEEIDQPELPVDKLESFVELHIEQGMQIEKNNADIGVVNGVSCPVRLKISVYGMANHTGTTPMNQRRDAFVAITPLVNFISDEAIKINKSSSHSLVATVSTINLKPNSMNVIPGEVELGVDIRSVDDEIKRRFADTIREYCNCIEDKNDVSIEIKTLVDNDSVILDIDVQQKLIQASNENGYYTYTMDSGAGHDVMNMAKKWPSGLIFIPCKDGISHQPGEFTSIRNLEKGINTLTKYLQINAEK